MGLRQDVANVLDGILLHELGVGEVVDEQLVIPGERLPNEEAVLLGGNVCRGDPLIKLTTIRPPGALRVLAIPLRRRALVE
eukprot:14658422-Alexandrium_andersonii.AAC.1